MYARAVIGELIKLFDADDYFAYLVTDKSFDVAGPGEVYLDFADKASIYSICNIKNADLCVFFSDCEVGADIRLHIPGFDAILLEYEGGIEKVITIKQVYQKLISFLI